VSPQTSSWVPTSLHRLVMRTVKAAASEAATR
jgi:hypothetical protein